MPAEGTVARYARRARELATPSLVEVFFLGLLASAAFPGRWQGLLADGDTGWHIRTGELILASGRVPQVDPFSFSRAGQPWLAWEWLSDVLFAGAYRCHGTGVVAALAGVVLCLAGTALFAWLLDRGAGLLLASAMALAACSASSVHYLARPHVFSIFFYTLSLWTIDRDGRRQSARLWLLVPLAAVWANMHAGFVVLPATLALLAAVRALERQGSQARRYGAAAGLCLLATGLNPYGWRLHLHILRYTRSPWILDHVQEFQSPSIRSESMVVFTVLLLAGVALASRALSSGQRFEGVLVLGWGFAALCSARHIPFYAIAAAPVMASECARCWSRAAERAPVSVRAARLLGTGPRPGAAAAGGRLAGACGGGSAPAGTVSRSVWVPGGAVPGAGGRAQPGTARAGPRRAAHFDLGSVGRLPDIPSVSAAAGLLRRAQRFLRSGRGGGLPQPAGRRGELAGPAGAVRLSGRAAAVRLAAQHHARPGARMEAGIPGPGRGPLCPQPGWPAMSARAGSGADAVRAASSVACGGQHQPGRQRVSGTGWPAMSARAGRERAPSARLRAWRRAGSGGELCVWIAGLEW